MAERDSLWVTGAVDQEEARVGTGALLVPATSAVKAKTGLRPGAAAAGQVTATGTPDANVHIAPFQAFLQSGRGTVAGAYVMTLDATKDINILSTPAHASLARRDLIIAHQADTFYGDGNSLMTVRQVVGTPSGSPADPSLAAFPDCIQLARVTVAANATTISSGNITDLRPSWTVALGGLLPVASSTARGTLTGLYDGYTIYRQDRDWVEIYDGSAWRVQGVAIVTSTGDLSAITSPYSGQLASNTGDGGIYRYTGSAWAGPISLAGRSAGVSLAATTGTTTSASYVDIAGASFSFTKIGSASQTSIKVDIHIGSYSTVSATTMKLGALINGTDYDLTQFTFNAANNHLTQSGLAVITGIAAGAYTIKGRWKRTAGSGTLTQASADDWVAMAATEVTA